MQGYYGPKITFQRVKKPSKKLKKSGVKKKVVGKKKEGIRKKKHPKSRGKKSWIKKVG